MPDPVYMPQQENEEILQEDIPQSEQQNEMPQTPGPSNPSHDNTQPINPESPTNDTPEQETQDDQPQNTNSNLDINSALTNFMESPTFHETMKRMTLQVGEDTFNRIAKNPRLVKEWILQVIHRIPGLHDDLTDNTLEHLNTNDGPIRILQPTTSQNPQPLDQQDYETSQVKEVAPHPSYSVQQQQQNNDASTIPSSTSPGIISSEDCDSDDCVIEKVSPDPKTKPHKRHAPPPDVTSAQVIIRKIPHKQGDRCYTVTTTPDNNRHTTTQNNTGLAHNRTEKTPRLQDQTLQPSTSTGTFTKQRHKDKKHKKHKKGKYKDKDN